MKKREFMLILFLFLFAFGLRFYNLSYPDFKWMDEAYHVPAATNYWSHGQFEPDNWEHPPLRHVILYGFLELFGDNPYGWRLRNVLFGAITVVLTYLFAREISQSRKVALMAGLLLATDPLHIVLSRFTFEEVYGGTFFLAAIVLYTMHNERCYLFILSALFMGCALATKWYYVPCWIMIPLLALAEKDHYKKPGTALFLLSTYLLVPLSVFLLSYYQWFGRGYSISDLIEFLKNAYNALQLYQRESYDFNLFFLKHTSVSEWFVSPVIVGQGTYVAANRGEFVLFMNSMPIWILTIPSMIGLCIYAARKKNLRILLPVLFFCSSYMLYLFVRRPAFIYSAAPLLPFAFTAIAQGIALVADKYSHRIYSVALALMLAWNVYLYPLATAKRVPLAPYKYLLDRADVNIH